MTGSAAAERPGVDERERTVVHAAERGVDRDSVRLGDLERLPAALHEVRFLRALRRQPQQRRELVERVAPADPDAKSVEQRSDFGRNVAEEEPPVLLRRLAKRRVQAAFPRELEAPDDIHEGRARHAAGPRVAEDTHPAVARCKLRGELPPLAPARRQGVRRGRRAPLLPASAPRAAAVPTPPSRPELCTIRLPSETLGPILLTGNENVRSLLFCFQVFPIFRRGLKRNLEKKCVFLLYRTGSLNCFFLFNLKEGR